jgi:hypothetical protein
MILPTNRRSLVLATALMLTLAAVVWANRMDAPPEAPVAGARVKSDTAIKPAADATASGKLAVARIADLRRGEDAASPLANVFAAKSFYVAPPAPRKVAVKAPPPPPPTAPPLPFSYMGMLKEGGGATVVFVVNGERLHTVRVGDVIDGTYRVEAIGAEGVTFVYLPMGEKQVLRTGDST